jgi:hypothetical protein
MARAAVAVQLPWIAGNFEELAQGIEPLDISAMQVGRRAGAFMRLCACACVRLGVPGVS